VGRGFARQDPCGAHLRTDRSSVLLLVAKELLARARPRLAARSRRQPRNGRVAALPWRERPKALYRRPRFFSWLQRGLCLCSSGQGRDHRMRRHGRQPLWLLDVSHDPDLVVADSIRPEQVVLDGEAIYGVGASERGCVTRCVRIGLDRPGARARSAHGRRSPPGLQAEKVTLGLSWRVARNYLNGDRPPRAAQGGRGRNGRVG
jgi:hypothetical protein